jgi:transposase-like protein
MTKTQVEVITSVQRRRRWSRAEKERIVAAAIEPRDCIRLGYSDGANMIIKNHYAA